MDETIPKLPRYVFRRANGSYRYKRNVPKVLRQVIPKATVYRQLGESYDEAIRRLPIVHAEIEALFDQERATPNSIRAKSIVRERLGEWHADAFADRVVDPEWDVMDEFVELADALEGSTPPEVIRQVGTASITPEPMTLLRVLDEYYAYKCEDGVENTPLKTRIERLRKDLIIALGKNRVEWTPLADITRVDANTVRDYLLTRMAPNSVLRTLGVIKAAINHVIIENDLEQRNVFQGIKIKGAGASKDDRLPMSDGHVASLLTTYETTPTAYALFVILCDTGARLAEIVGLEAQDIDLEACCLHIRPNSLRSLKTKTSDRTIPLSPRVIDDLREHQGVARGTAPLFPQYARPRGSDAASAMLMKRLRTQISDKKITIHSLRHRMKDKLRNTGCPEAISLAILGHSTNTVAANYGSGYALDIMREHMERVW
ncbi:tyrosine-type recombinase/integrase [Thalassobacter stenotrophicus]|uniref:tyrosine-type recombinase/integrase n=1 Tax=Thalassobacter stenotrophicus TaxID=266809 RepID=UPI0022A90F97|nr:tyrosine-type recombinase/integrase [Thalassobacter stenotrophicus]UYP67355.1 tyrosine-type recombinase/integrase [Thalassobacter stenotrophicus]